MSAVEKRARLFGEPYVFSLQATHLLPGRHSARLVTDINLQEGDGWGINDRLAYYLYPIDIRIHSGTGKEDVLIYFHKDKAVQFLPKDYKIIFKPSDIDLVAARKGAL
ncbi:MAG: hypothetical protein HQL14_08185 [Candidatus Omnitrophica bacterium]|nr:hypothetical protein [Candidatus Omnitrophota bacterium]